jgi:hypothetical protein
MPDPNRNYVKAQETILELLKQLQTWRPSKLTREDINYLRERLDLLEYLLAPKRDGTIEPVKKPLYQTCFDCGTQLSTGYQHQGRWYCPKHFPDGVAYPIGMHGEDFKAYQERKK